MNNKVVEISVKEFSSLLFSNKTGMNLIMGGEELSNFYFNCLKERLLNQRKKDCLISCSEILTDEWFISKLFKPYKFINGQLTSRNCNELIELLKYYDQKMIFTKPYIRQFNYILEILRQYSQSSNYFHIDLPFEEFYQEYSDMDYFNDKKVLLFEELHREVKSLRTSVNVLYKFNPSVRILSSLETEQAKRIKSLFDSIIVLKPIKIELSIIYLGKGREPVEYKVKSHLQSA